VSESARPARRSARVLLGLALLVWAGVLALYGLFAIVYEGDGGADARVEVSGRDLDADLVGGIALALAVAAILAGAIVLRRSRARAR
jgi:hypothetical protein